MVQIVSEPIDPQQSFQLLQRCSSSSVLLHYAVVKSDGGTGRISCAAEYQAEPEARAELERIAAVLKDRWPLEGILLRRRAGRLAVGGIIFLVAVSARASMDSFAACHAGLERLEKMQTIRKQEVFA